MKQLICFWQLKTRVRERATEENEQEIEEQDEEDIKKLRRMLSKKRY